MKIMVVLVFLVVSIFIISSCKDCNCDIKMLRNENGNVKTLDGNKNEIFAWVKLSGLVKKIGEIGIELGDSSTFYNQFVADSSSYSIKFSQEAMNYFNSMVPILCDIKLEICKTQDSDELKNLKCRYHEIRDSIFCKLNVLCFPKDDGKIPPLNAIKVKAVPINTLKDIKTTEGIPVSPITEIVKIEEIDRANRKVTILLPEPLIGNTDENGFVLFTITSKFNQYELYEVLLDNNRKQYVRIGDGNSTVFTENSNKNW